MTQTMKLNKILKFLHFENVTNKATIWLNHFKEILMIQKREKKKEKGVCHSSIFEKLNNVLTQNSSQNDKKIYNISSINLFYIPIL
jgi:hypothetical protein